MVLQQNLYSIPVMTHQVLSLNTTNDAGNEEVFPCFSCLKLCSVVLRFPEANIPSPTDKSDFPHCPSIISCIQCCMFVVCRTERIPPAHTSHHQLLGYSFLHCPSLVMLLWIPVVPPPMTLFWSGSEYRQDVTMMSEMF